MLRILLLSTSTVHGNAYMQYALPHVSDFLGGLDPILFVPYARPGGISHERYTATFATALNSAGHTVQGIHDTRDPVVAVNTAKAIFIGGGNTFVLLRALYENRLLQPIRDRVAGGIPYLGSSAGSNVAGLSIGTSNDMPIVYPPSFEALGLVPFNINPHYLDPDPESTHMGETRETRIKEFHGFNRQPVVGLREGALLRIEDATVGLDGVAGGRLFRHSRPPQEIEPETSLDFLVQE